MLSWGEEITSTVSPLPSFSLPETQLAERSTNRSADFDPVPHNPLAPVTSAVHARPKLVPPRHDVAADKRIINNKTDINQLAPFKCKWAWEKYLSSSANHWMPPEVSMPRNVLGMSASMFRVSPRYIANLRAPQIGLDPLLPSEETPFTWMSEMIDLQKEHHFFESRVIEYQSGAALSR